MPDIKNTTTHYRIVDPHHLSSQFISTRYRQLSSLTSQHFYSFTEVRRQDKSIYIDYPIRHASTLKQHLNRGDLADSQAINLIWQITKLMCECEDKKINHLRLSPEAIALRQVETSNGQEWFIWVKDFSFGREFRQVDKGIDLQHFQYMHPSFCLDCKSSSFKQQQYHPIYDIWAFAVIIYRMIYKTTPFPGQRQSFSPDTMKKFINSEYRIKYPNIEKKSLNQFIRFCLVGKFSSWHQIKQFLIDLGQTYSQMDFEAVPFQNICERHVRLMFLFSSVHTTIIHQCRHSDVNFWHERPSGQSFPFVMLIAEATLIIMNHIHSRFKRLYSVYSALLPVSSILFEQIDVITDSIASQIDNYQQLLLTRSQYKNTPDKNSPSLIDDELLFLIQRHCIQTKLMSGVGRNKARVKYKDSSLSRKIKPSLQLQEDTSFLRPLTSYKEDWKSVDIVFDYCDALIQIINHAKHSQKRVQNLTQLCHQSQVLNEMVVQDYKYITPEHTQEQEEDSLLFLLPLMSFKSNKRSMGQ